MFSRSLVTNGVSNPTWFYGYSYRWVNGSRRCQRMWTRSDIDRIADTLRLNPWPKWRAQSARPYLSPICKPTKYSIAKSLCGLSVFEDLHFDKSQCLPSGFFPSFLLHCWYCGKRYMESVEWQKRCIYSLSRM